MKVVYNKRHLLHSPKFEFFDGKRIPYPETSSRADAILRTLKDSSFHEIVPARQFELRDIAECHRIEYIEYLRSSCKRLLKGEAFLDSYCFDTYTPVTRGTYEAAVSSAFTSLTGAHLIEGSTPLCYALCRPPGHHASKAMMAGYCFFNNAAIAAKRLSRNGDVAILDIDIHHGNGTQNIFYSTDRVFYVSLHAHPRIFPYLWGFPSERGVGDGLGFNRNFILPDNITENSYLTIADEALLLIREFDPKRVIISAGFDTFKDDPVSKNSGVRSKLGVRFYERLSRRISRTLDVPTLIVQEGGYNVGALGQCVMSFLNGFR